MNIEVTGHAVPRLTRREVAAFVRKVLLAADRDLDVTVAFVDDDAMKSLNRKFRRKNKTTDVLTFPGDTADIIISIDQARRQAIDERHSIATEVRYLLVHGVLHALGYDHEVDDGEMNDLEVEIRGKVGLD